MYLKITEAKRFKIGFLENNMLMTQAILCLFLSSIRSYISDQMYYKRRKTTLVFIIPLL